MGAGFCKHDFIKSDLSCKIKPQGHSKYICAFCFFIDLVLVQICSGVMSMSWHCFSMALCRCSGAIRIGFASGENCKSVSCSSEWGEAQWLNARGFCAVHMGLSTGLWAFINIMGVIVFSIGFFLFLICLYNCYESNHSSK